MEIEFVRRRVRLARSVTTGAQVHDERERLFVRVRAEGATGYGEVAPQPGALNGDPGIDEVVDELVERVGPRVLEAAQREGAAPAWFRVARMAGERPASRASAAAIEMALLDAQLRTEGRDVEELWPARYAPGVVRTVSVIGEDEWGDVEGAARVRVKVAAGARIDDYASRLESLDVPVIVDFNASGRDLDEVVGLVERVARHARVALVEQPFAVGDLATTAQLRARLDVPLGLDEGVRAVRDVEQIARYGAASVLCVKPARVGGLAEARGVIDRARDRGLETYLGGFFESPYARAVHASFARHAVALPSDVAIVPTTGDERLVVVAGSFGVQPDPAVFEGATRVLAGGPRT